MQWRCLHSHVCKVLILIILDIHMFPPNGMFCFVTQPKQYASGFTGDVGDGPTTAYDALPPKKWKPN